MKTAVIRASWMEGYGYRLDTQPYVGGALQAKILLEELPLRKDPLHTLTKGHDGGIYNGPQFRRNYVEDPAHGVRFLTGSSMQLADLSNVSLLSRRDATGKKLRHLRLERGMTLISCSGSIGKMAYVRPEMAGIWSSQDILKVVPDPEKIPPGYLYAFLSSKFGVPLVTSGTYGAIIQHLEPEHIAGIGVPRLDPAQEQEIHDLVEEAAQLRSEAASAKATAIHGFNEWTGYDSVDRSTHGLESTYGITSSESLGKRMDGAYYFAPALNARRCWDQKIAEDGGAKLGGIADVFIPTIFKREYAQNPEDGVPYITGADVFQIRPSTELFLHRSIAEKHRLTLTKGMILIHEAGQRYGLIGRSAYVHKTFAGWSCTNNMVRVAPKKHEDTGFLFTVLSSNPGVLLLKREAAGSSIPHLDANNVADIEVPWPSREKRFSLGQPMDESISKYEQANELEDRSSNLLKTFLKVY
ncbi:MAG: restriction endonuclease subunit S [Opitutales bacterium]|nr:restriction endonuclease subunit S [Opitutales bacterium]